MIIRGGENIYPAELEDFLHTHPKVQEVQVRLLTRPSPSPPNTSGAVLGLQVQDTCMGTEVMFELCLSPWKVVGVKDNRMGEEICACIRLKTGEQTTPEELKAFCKGKVGVLGPLQAAIAPFLNPSLSAKPSCPDLPFPHSLVCLSDTLPHSGLQISHFKIPRYFVFVTSYPLTVSGKVREGTGESRAAWGPCSESYRHESILSLKKSPRE